MPRPSVRWGRCSGRFGVALAFVLVCGVNSLALAGGTEFPADGTRGLGRGGTGMARADDPSVMMRNPALLADLWDDQALIGAHVLNPDSCFTPTGVLVNSQVKSDIVDLGDGPVLASGREGPWAGEAIPKVCYSGPEPFLPAIALSTKLRDDLGIGLGFLPPEIASLSQWGNRDGTVDTPNGKRPNILRYLGSHLNVTYFSLLGAVGYRPTPWLRVGFGFQWQMVAANATTFSQAAVKTQQLSRDVRVDVFTRDLFVPGIIGSVHLVPVDSVDVALGFKWSDRVNGRAKLDLLTGPFGTTNTGDLAPIQRAVPSLSRDQGGEVNAPPIWAPQLSASLRYGHRLRPRPTDYSATRAATDGAVEDHMASELFDIELSFIYYLNSAYDSSTFLTEGGTVTFQDIGADGTLQNSAPFPLGACVKEPASGQGCLLSDSRTDFGGIDQISLRLGGDYNIVPGVLALRAGASYETDGQERGYLNPRYYMFERIGVHAGFTWRVAGKTDISFAYAHFFQAEIRTQFNAGMLRSGVPKEVLADGEKYNYEEGEHDGVALVEVPYGTQYQEGVTPEMGPNFANAGSLYYNLDVFSLAITQHF